MNSGKLKIFLSILLILIIIFTIEPVSGFTLAEKGEVGLWSYVSDLAQGRVLITTDTTCVEVTPSEQNTGVALFKFTNERAGKLIDNATAYQKAGKQVLIQMKSGESKRAKKTVIQIENLLVKRLSMETNACLEINTGLVAIRFGSAGVASLYSASRGEDIKVNVKEIPDSDLPAEIKDIVGDRPVYDISITAGDMKISDFGGEAIRVSVYYTLNKGEDPDAIVLYYFNNKSKAVQATGKFNEITQSLEFITTRLSQFAVGYRYIEFSDIKSNPNKDDIEFAASRDMLCGMGKNEFGPDEALTRGMLVTVLVKLAGIEPARAAGYEDVVPEKYYSQYIGWAAANGLVAGVGNNRFRPDKAVSREELAVILNNFIKYMDLMPETKNDRVRLSDMENILYWAKEAVKNMVTLGIIPTEPDNRFEPDKLVTRADFAAVLKKIIEISLESD